MIDPTNINTLWTSFLIEELRRLGVTHMCVSPGSRSAPLTVAAARNKQITTTVHFDERGAAFFALGHARATGQPVALICTSGTAVANYLPAVAEAIQDELPLILLTADRPPELQNCGANQTICQPGLFGRFVRRELDLPCPEDHPDLRALLSSVGETVVAALSSPRGPIHINCPFREPLAPTPGDTDLAPALSRFGDWINSGTPLTPTVPQSVRTDRSRLDSLAGQLHSARRGLVVIGQLASASERDAVSRLVTALGWPTLPDITSGLRLMNHDSLIAHYDLLLLSDRFAAGHAPEMILHLGGRFVSKRLLQFIERVTPTRYVVLNGSPARLDPADRVTEHITTDMVIACVHLSTCVTPQQPTEWLRSWRDTSDRVAAEMTRLCDGEGPATEPTIARLLLKHLSDNTALWTASSMPIRDLDIYAHTGRGAVDIVANRGASGIDGTIASACGYARGSRKPVTALLGDLASLHDLNSLALAAASEYPVTLVVLNNNGGRIFEHLPIAEHADVCESHFVSPHGLTFDHAAAMFGLFYVRVDDTPGFVAAINQTKQLSRSSLIEVTVDPVKNRAHHERIRSEIRDALERG